MLRMITTTTVIKSMIIFTLCIHPDLNINYMKIYFEGDINKDIDVQIKPFAYL